MGETVSFPQVGKAECDWIKACGYNHSIDRPNKIVHDLPAVIDFHTGIANREMINSCATTNGNSVCVGARACRAGIFWNDCTINTNVFRY